MKTILETNRLIIREVVESDFSFLREVISDPVNMRYYPKPYNEADVKRWISWCISSYKDNGFCLFSLELKDSHTYIGDCGFSYQIIDGEKCVELGYHLHTKYQHQGYIYEASKIILDYGFNTLNFNEIYSYMNIDNISSRCVALRNGMSFVKKYDEDNITHIVYKINKEDYLKNNNNFKIDSFFNRVILVGSPGSGKSYLSKKISEKLNLPLHHLDMIYWKPNWVGIAKEEFINIQKEIMKGDRWIIDGSYVATLNIRLQRADTVIMLDFSSNECLKNEKNRRGKPRSDLPSYLVEKLDPSFIDYIKHYPDRETKLIKAVLFNYPKSHIITLHNRKEMDEFIKRINEYEKSNIH